MTWNAAMMDETMGHFRALATFWSTLDSDRKPASNVPVTLTTIGSVNRLPQLYAQCAAYAGPLSVALYLPIMQDLGPITPANQAILRDAVLQTAQFVMDVKAMQGSCQPDVLLIYEIFADDLAKALNDPSGAEGATRAPLEARERDAGEARCWARFGRASVAGRGASILLPLSPESIDAGAPEEGADPLKAG